MYFTQDSTPTLTLSQSEAISTNLPNTQAETKPRKVKKTRVTPVTTQNKPSETVPNLIINLEPAAKPPRVCYQWSCGLAYDSIQENGGQVKRLTNSFLLDDLWFGYIPDWLKEDEHYNEEFERKLTYGFIKKNCIRDIIKELQTKVNQNFSTEHPYKFKIVVQNYNYRIYG